MSDGRAVTAGMDGKVCVWERGTDRCSYLTWRGVQLSSISKVVADEARPLVFAADYDGCVTAWDLSQPGRSSLEGGLQLAKHGAPALDFTYAGQVLASVARDGTLFSWDLSTGELQKRYRAHSGHATCVVAMSGHGCFVSGGQDGFLKLWDLREPRTTQKIAAHTSRAQTGAVGQIIVCSEGGAEQLISFGADKAICVHDSRMSHRELYRWEHHRHFIYSMALTGQRFVATGAGDGMLLVHDLATGGLCYGIGACKNGAVRAVASDSDHLYIINEDGDAIEYSF
jgi:F-box/WD-40 domain protein 7